MNITPAYDILLRGSKSLPVGLYHLHMATASQLCSLHYSRGSIKAVQAKLKKLVDSGYVQFDAVPTKFTRSPYYYVLAELGIRYLGKAGMDVDSSFRAAKEVDKHALFVSHTLELNDVIISAALLKKSDANYWLDGFIHERAMKLKPYKSVWQGSQFTLIPDAFLDFRLRKPEGIRRIPVLLEHDRGTEEQRYFRRRIRAYITMLGSEAYKRLYGVGSITIAFTTSAGPRRLGQIREWTWAELQGNIDPLAKLFYFTALNWPISPHRLWLEPCWYDLDSNKPISILGV